MEVVDNRTTRKDNNKTQTTKIIYDIISMSMTKKITKPKSHQIKPKQNIITYNSLNKMRDLSSMRLVNESKKKRCEVQKYVSIFENN